MNSPRLSQPIHDADLSLTELAARVAHDLNNVLSPIILAAGLLRERTTDPDQLRLIDRIEDGGMRGAALSRRLLEASRGGGATILCVESEPDVLVNLVEALSQAGYRTVAKSSASEAFEELRSGRRSFAAVIADMRLSDMEGPSFLATIRRDGPRLPILGISGVAVAASVEKWVGQGCAGILEKPFSSAELLRSLGDILASANSLKMNPVQKTGSVA